MRLGHWQVCLRVWLRACAAFCVVLLAASGAARADYPAAAWDAEPDGARWTAFAHAAVEQHGQSLLQTIPTDIEQFCPGFASRGEKDRQAFWVFLMSSLAKFESSYNPATSFDETTVDTGMVTRDGAPIISRGLLQISRESANGYGCGIADPQQLHDPETNIVCGVRIFNRWIERDGVISGKEGKRWRGLARYFSPFRSAKKLASMQADASRQPYCR